MLLSIYNINKSSAFNQSLPVWGYINYEFTQSFFVDSMSSAFGIGQNQNTFRPISIQAMLRTFQNIQSGNFGSTQPTQTI